MAASHSGVRIFNPKDNPTLSATYSQISVVPISDTKRLISFAGQTGTSDSKSDNTKLSFADQVRLALEKVDKNLAAVGASKKDIIMIRQYVVKLTSRSEADMKTWEEIFSLWWRSTEGDALPPPDSLLGMDSLWSAETLIEIEVQCVADI